MMNVARSLRSSRIVDQSFRILAASLREPVWVIDHEGQIVFVNQAWMEFIGADPEEPIGVVWRRAIHADDLPRLSPWPDDRNDGSPPGEVVIRFRRSNGDEQAVLARLEPLQDEAGRITGILGVGQIPFKDDDSGLLLEKLFQTTFENSAVGMVQTGLDGRLQRVNQRFREMLGYDREDLLTCHWQEITHEGDLESNLEALQGLQSGEIDGYSTRKRYIRQDGEPVWVNLTVLLVRDNRKAPHSFISIVQDVSQQVLAEQELLQSEHLRQRALEIGQVYTFQWDASTDVPIVSSNAPAMVGRDRWFTSSGEFLAAVHHDDLDRYRTIVESLTSENPTYRTEFRIQRPDGTFTWLEEFGQAEFGDDGKMKLLHGLTRSVTASRQAMADVQRLNFELQAKVTELEAVLDTAPVGIHVTRDPKCQTIRSNRAFDEILGTAPGINVSKSKPSPEELNFHVFKNGVEVPGSELPMQRAVALNQPIQDELYDIIRNDGRVFRTLVRANPIRDASGAVVGGVAIGLDVTELKKAEEAIKAADRLKDEFLAILAHELRNPLAPLCCTLQVMRILDRDGAFGENLDIMERQLNQMVRLIDDLMDISRISRGKIQLQRRPIVLGDVIVAAIETSQTLIHERSHRLDVTVPADPIPLHADFARLSQVLSNLLSNAAKYTPPGGRIELIADRRDGEAVIRVKDNGIGIPGPELSRIFELFTQLDQSLDRSQGGLGIGLTLVQRLVSLHGGRVEAQSAGVNQGSEFVIYLPTDPTNFDHAAKISVS